MTSSRNRNLKWRGALAAACACALYSSAAQVLAAEPPEPPVLNITPPASTPLVFSAETLDAFIAWAGRSNDQDRELVRAYLHRAAPADWSLGQLYERFQKARAENFDGALVILSIIGELRNPKSIDLLQRIIWEPQVEDEKLDDARLTQRDTQEILQSKAVEGLAYLQSPESFKATLEIATKHPGQAVRSAAVDAFLFNAGDTEEARARLSKTLRREEQYMADRARKSATTDVDTFNKQLALFYDRYPEHIADKPEEPTKPEPDEHDKDPGSPPPTAEQAR